MDNVMTLGQYTDKMFSIMETALYNYEINTLVEASDDPEAAEANKASRFAKAIAVVKAAMQKVWDAIVSAFKWIVDKINSVAHKPITIDTDMEVYEGAIKPNTTLGMYAKELLNGRIDCLRNGKLEKELKDSLKKIPLRAGETINSRDILAVAKKYNAMAAQLRGIGFKGSEKDSNEATKACNKIADAYMKYAADCRKLCQKIVDIKQTDKKMEPMTDDASDDVTLAAQLIMEAAQLLSEGAEDYVDGIGGTQNDIDETHQDSFLQSYYGAE